MDYIKDRKLDRELIQLKSEAIKALETEFKDIGLLFNFKTIHQKRCGWSQDLIHVWYWSKTYYEISYLDENKEKTILKFYSKKGYKTLRYYLVRAFHTGGDEE